jgi:hypothetical protein
VVKKTLTALFVALSTLVAVNPSHAIMFTVNGTNYDIVTVTDTGTNLSAQLQSTPWWGTGSNNTTSFVNAVGSALGFPNTGGSGSTRAPLFAYQFQSTQFDTLFTYQLGGSTGLASVVYAPTTVATYAVIALPTAVPFDFDPTFGLTIFGGAWLVKKALKKKSTKI